MRKLFLAGLLAIACIFCSYSDTRANGWIAGRSQGFGWLGDKCLTCLPGIHQHGPLYNYTPMQGDYTWMQLHWHQLYNYTPAQPLYYGGQGYGGGGYGSGFGGRGGHSSSCDGGAFANHFGFGVKAACESCGGPKWFGWYHGGVGGSWWNIFHKSGFGEAHSTTGSSCSSCTSSAETPKDGVVQTSHIGDYSGVIQTSHVGNYYPDYLLPEWR